MSEEDIIFVAEGWGGYVMRSRDCAGLHIKFEDRKSTKRFYDWCMANNVSCSSIVDGYNIWIW